MIGLSNFAQNGGAHWDKMRLLEPHEILGTVLLVTKWAMYGEDIINEWEITLDGSQRARTAKILEQANIFLPLCTCCGLRLNSSETGDPQRHVCIPDQTVISRQ